MRLAKERYRSAILTTPQSLQVRNPGAGVAVHPGLGRIFIGQRPNLGALHDYARASVPTQNGVIVSVWSQVRGSLIMAHGFPQHVICGRAGFSDAMVNRGT